MKKLTLVYIFILLLWLICFILFTLNIYITIKYEIENINNDIIVDKIYTISDTFLVLSIFLFFISMLFGIIIYTKQRNKVKAAV